MIVVFEWKNIRNYISCFQAHNNTYLEKKNKRQYQNKNFYHTRIYIYIYIFITSI